MAVENNQMLDAVLTGNVVLPGQDPVEASIGVLNGKVVAISSRSALPEAAEEYNFENMLILPGGVDVHFHSLGYAGEGFINSTRGAAAGGVTTANDHPLDLGGAPTTAEEIRSKAEVMEQQVIVDFTLSAGVVSGKLQNIEGVAQGAGIAAYKALMHCTAPPDWYGIWALEDWELFEGFQNVAKTGLPILVHAENENMLVYYEKVFRESGRISAAAHSESRPKITEIEAVNRALCLANEAGVHLHIVHVSLPESFELISEARAKGTWVTGETCPHFLLLTNERWKEVGMMYKINPPLRSKQARDGLWKALREGRIDLISSDHSPRDEATSDIVFENPSGTPGVETMIPLMFSEGVVKGRLSLQHLIELTSVNPARLLGIYPKKGSLQLGADADLVVLDPKKEWVVDGSKLQTGCKLSAFEGINVTGKPVATFVRGKQVYREGEFPEPQGYGQFVPRLSWSGPRNKDRG